MSPLVYLISGAGRGLGLGLVRVLAKRDNVVVFAGARKPSSELQAIAAEHPDKVRIVKLTSGDEADNKAAVAEIQRIAGRLDIVIANAGIGEVTGPVLSTSAQAMVDHFFVNAIGTLVLFQASYPLLKESTPTPKFIPISSSLGSIALRAASDYPSLAYGASKTAVNYIARKIRADHEGLVCFPLCPGAIDTDMASRSLAVMGQPLPPSIVLKSAEETAEHVLARIDEGTRETDVFILWNGEVRPW